MSAPEETAGRAARRRAPPGLARLWATPRTARPGRREPWGVRWDQRSQRGQPARLGLWDKGREREDWHGRGESLAWSGLACVALGRGCVCVGVQVNTLLPEAETWVDPECGGRGSRGVPHRERKRESEIKGNEVCGFLCVCVSGPAAQH